jgi:ribokinase
VLNASPWRPLSLDTLDSVDYLVLNELEAAALAAAFDWPSSPRELALAAAGAVQGLTAVVTLGEHGALAARDTTLLRVLAPSVCAIDTTGAGDAFGGTLIASLDDDAPLDEALRRAVAAGSLACTAAGAQPSLPERSAVETVLERMGR